MNSLDKLDGLIQLFRYNLETIANTGITPLIIPDALGTTDLDRYMHDVLDSLTKEDIMVAITHFETGGGISEYLSLTFHFVDLSIIYNLLSNVVDMTNDVNQWWFRLISELSLEHINNVVSENHYTGEDLSIYDEAYRQFQSELDIMVNRGKSSVIIEYSKTIFDYLFNYQSLHYIPSSSYHLLAGWRGLGIVLASF